MMFTIKQKDLNDKLQSICSVVDSKSANDPIDKILDCAYFQVGEEKITITASSSDIQAITTINGNFSSEPVNFSINARNLSEIIRTLPSLLDINFTVTEHTVELSCGKSRFTLPNFINIPYPVLNIKKRELLFDINAKLLEKAFQSVSFSMGSHHLRYYLSGCMIKVVDGQIIFVSTDTHRLSFYNIRDEKLGDKNQSMILPKKAILYLDKMLSAAGDKMVSTEISANDYFIVNTGDYEIISKLIVGAYPEFERVFSMPTTAYATADTQIFKESLQRVAVLATDKFRTVRFNIAKDVLGIEAKSLVNETAQTELDIKYTGESISFNFNAGYLSDLLSRFDEKEIRLSFSDENASVFFSFEGNEHFKYVLMPLRV